MTTREDARALVEQYLAEQDLTVDVDVVLLDDATIERPWGWVFFYESRQFVESGDSDEFLLGNVPLIVERGSGRLILTGSAESIEFYVENYEATGDPHLRPGRDLELYSARPDADRLAAAREFRVIQ